MFYGAFISCGGFSAIILMICLEGGIIMSEFLSAFISLPTLYVYPSSKDSQVRMMLSAWRQIFFSSRILTDELALVGTYHCKVSKCSLRLRREEIGLSHKTPVSLQSSKTLQFCNGGTNGSNFFTT